MKFSKLLNYFKSEKLADSEYVPNFWEDDYCQIELVPQENKKFIKQQINAANSFAKKHNTENGYTSVFIRQPLITPTISKEIRADYLRSTLNSFQMPQLTDIKYEGGGNKSLRNINIEVFGFPCCTLFFDTEGEFVGNIWIKFGLITSSNQFDIILSTLYYLGEENKLILVDWNDDQVVDITNKSQVKNYLMDW